VAFLLSVGCKGTIQTSLKGSNARQLERSDGSDANPDNTWDYQNAPHECPRRVGPLLCGRRGDDKVYDFDGFLHRYVSYLGHVGLEVVKNSLTSVRSPAAYSVEGEQVSQPFKPVHKFHNTQF